jgi:hypothetical protein
MFLRHKLRRKDGKEHRYWSIVENRRVSGGRIVPWVRIPLILISHSGRL